MIRRVVLENFVNLTTRQEIKFEANESPYILVGENGSGKSAIFEGIRRCLKSSVSTTRSSLSDKSKPGFFLCKYDTTRCEESELQVYKNLYTGIIRKNDNVYKFVSAASNFSIDIAVPREDGQSQHNCSFFEVTDKSEAGSLFTMLDEDAGMSDVQKLIVHEPKIKLEESKVETILALLDKYIVLTFSLRSIGPLQWSKSENIKSNKMEANYKTASNRDEIITYFLDNPHEFNLKLHDSIFQNLTGNSKLTFKFRESKSENLDSIDRCIHVTSTDARLPGGQYALLKTPEGILEAKYFSIIMSNNTFKTIILEEPDHGMHPQMVERMLVLIQREKEKCVILSTHNTGFVNFMTIPQLIICRKTYVDPDKSISSVIISGKVMGAVRLPNESKWSVVGTESKKIEVPLEPSTKTLRALMRGHFATLIFARRVLLCEGDSDFLFLTALRENLIQWPSGAENVLRLAKLELEKNKELLQDICASLHIVNMDGWLNSGLFWQVCHLLKLDEHYFVCDLDAIVNDQRTQLKANEWMEKSKGDKYKRLRKDFSSKLIDSSKVLSVLRDEFNCFAWKDGTIEDMVMSLCRSDSFVEVFTNDQYTHRVGWYENRELIEQLKVEKVVLPDLSRWKKPRKERADKEQKLFLSPEVSQVNVLNSVKAMLEACNHESDDLVQFVLFIWNMAKHK